MEIQLKVAGARQEDVGRGIVRIDKKFQRKMNAVQGDVVEITGNRGTAAIVIDAYPDDTGLDIIRMDGLIRKNAKTTMGEFVKIKKADVKPAKNVALAPTQRGMRIMISGNVVSRNLRGRVLKKGDVISLVSQRKDPFAESIFSDLFDVISGSPFGLGEIRFVVVNTSPSGIVQMTNFTKVEVLPEAAEIKETEMPTVTYEDIGGLKKEIQKVREMIELPLKHPELFDRLGIEPPKGVLLYGPPGTGKTLIAKAVASESNAHFISINGPEIMSKFYGQSEENLRKIFSDAEKNAPSIIFIDEIDAIAPKREEVTGEVERRVVAQLLALMDGLQARGKVIVIAATNRPEALEPALRRPGRFDREIEIGVATKNGRKEILQIHTRGMPLENVNLDYLAGITYGFVGADLEALCKEAAMNSLRRILPEINLEEERIPPEVLEKIRVTKKDFEESLKVVEPSAMREVFVQTPNVKWDDIGGLQKVKEELRESVEWPLKYPERFKKMGIRPPKGIFLYGPPGCGKTLLAKAVACESEANFISIKGPEILSKWVGESEKAVRKIFRKARQVSPSIVFFDEIDSIAAPRGEEIGSRVGERVVDQLLTEMDGLEELSNVIVIGATNRPDIIDPGLLRPGRFDRKILVPAPDKKEKLEILKRHTKTMPLAKDVDLKYLAEKTEDFSGADLEGLVREAAMIALRENENIKEVSMSHFKKALEEITPSIDKETIRSYELPTMKKSTSIYR
ncbi:MAG: CDC48 family AAA ATPase [Methanomicrobia archaeon]|nr:CDC48 family AAA ATPase [Methanomicrobia archaeon]MCK4636820.1 CDC48 family AAA ATPase [Methanomicrobia archaeon]